ncbi:MipA/OmpV family protein [Kosakonia sp. CCTCC M2018092]|uniref:MipA/OmpV family protein n=1 Tax=Kosakonia sp. CCTCC M2018092 TaxID=2492396 RepID=UPI000F611B25|nr:MipA/OmpV family protein [Kosakonia sp. CCTCC M2018092]AZI87995.1 MipA/OmpV family protein [Kosakonia sp. CCTCC M2018092]
MRNTEPRRKFLPAFLGRPLKNIVPGALLALLATPTLAAEPPQGTTLTLGGGVGVAPRYSGSDENRVSTALVLDYSMRNGFFVSSTRGLGYGNSLGNLDYSAALSYRTGRKDHNVDSDTMSDGSDYLRGMGNVKGSALGVVGLGYKLTNWLSAQLQAEVPFSQRDNGAALHFGIVSPLYHSPKNSVTLGLTSSWGTNDYMQTYYGVSAAQSAASGFTQYTAGSGIYACSLNLDWTHNFTESWSVVADAGYTQLAGDARNSPIVQRKASPTGSLTVTYRF